ncbi:MAG: hypothetical protein R3A12_05050 [Ignavibacteria bacterium]
MAKQRTSGLIQTETSPLIKTFSGEGKNVILAMTGTSGSIYGLRMLRVFD